MQNIETIPSPAAPWAISKNILNEAAASLCGDLHLLAPGAEKAVDLPSPGALVLFVVDGPVTVSSGLRNFILQAESALHLPPGSKYVLRNRDASLAKVLVLSLPPPRPTRGLDELVMLRA